ncbi:MAG: TraR/DksA family transcriptional regulator, partial [Bacteroidota bacterium]
VERRAKGMKKAAYAAAELAYFQDMLLKLKDELVEEIQAARESSNEVMRGFSFTLLQNLRAVEAALRRVDEGRFGSCVSCGSLIEKGRLEAIPYTHLCVRCKQGSSSKDRRSPIEPSQAA